MKVLLPTPGGPVMPTRTAPPVCGTSSSRIAWPSAAWSAPRALEQRDGPGDRPPVRPPDRVPIIRDGREGPAHARRARITWSTSRAASGTAVPGPKIAATPRSRRYVVVLRRNDAADHHRDVARPVLVELFDQLRHQGLVARRLARDADHVHVVLDGHARRLGGHLEQRPDVDVEAEVREGGGDHLHAAVVAVLAELHDEHARAPPLGFGEVHHLARAPSRTPRRPGTRCRRPPTPIARRRGSA